jgi:hypothetical protein
VTATADEAPATTRGPALKSDEDVEEYGAQANGNTFSDAAAAAGAPSKTDDPARRRLIPTGRLDDVSMLLDAAAALPRPVDDPAEGSAAAAATPVGNPDAEAADSEPEGGGGGGVLGAAVERAAAAGPLAFALLNALVSCVPLPGGPAALSFAAGLLCARPTETSTQLKTLLNPLSLTLSQAAWLSPHTLLTARLAPVRRCGGRHCVLRGKRGRRR